MLNLKRFFLIKSKQVSCMKRVGVAPSQINWCSSNHDHALISFSNGIVVPPLTQSSQANGGKERSALLWYNQQSTQCNSGTWRCVYRCTFYQLGVRSNNLACGSVAHNVGKVLKQDSSSKKTYLCLHSDNFTVQLIIIIGFFYTCTVALWARGSVAHM